ncbi:MULTISPECIES: cell division protein ZapA [Vibrio]|uniref:cell division protein ZapA n=1 Tax=Vibrio TaxID=662 RepID=UPI000C16353C|nr:MULTISPECIES: cell division protein ZapA [Vibrio]NAW69066.1 cell division protein ZapA [Vibrio sp. V28_P6S34P95]NAX04321.1 cell division protein ZapA [Vibrio sp. V30_P3S12P165]NAX35726.1 cell division protein ZapA [Vibrio sp. V29_P1S30P107]NAX36151.1 cell division protein ZapA [Vibrio sp. V27_P1S3P104]NAX39266.1 cell division protein ZapA [Vibrio sp. V26_P1S5P106]
MSNQAVEVEILGKITRVNCPKGQESSLVRAAQDLDQRLKDMAERTKVTNEVKLLTIAALNICYELQTERQKQDDLHSQLNRRVDELANSLQAALNKVQQQGH